MCLKPLMNHDAFIGEQRAESCDLSLSGMQLNKD